MATPAGSTARGRASQLTHAYAVCRGVTRRAARNFYYAFLVLPSEKRDALCAVYAFMRHADDIADDEHLSAADKLAQLQAWREQMQRALGGEVSDDPVLFALADAQQRFSLRTDLLGLLVEGTGMDVRQAPPDAAPGVPAVLYATYADLERYCYHVASVVGLICIRVFGYHDAAAEPLAERTGIAFQLTNIIRDVREDALMGRVYLPQEDMLQFSRSPFELSAERLGNSFDAAPFRPLLELEAQRARECYRAADQLLPLIDEDCRPALWVLVEIYRRLLEKIAQRGYDVFGEKVRVSTAEKLRVLAMGFWRRLAG